MDRVFWVDFRRLALMLLPTFLRRGRMVAIATSLLAPLQELHASLLRYRAATAWRLGHNSQVCYLRGALNDLLDPALRRITVADTPPSHGLTLVPLREAGAPLLTGLREQEVATVIGRRGFAVGGYDFIVTIPPGVDATRAAAATREFKLASKRFIIVIE